MKLVLRKVDFADNITNLRVIEVSKNFWTLLNVKGEMSHFCHSSGKQVSQTLLQSLRKVYK